MAHVAFMPQGQAIDAARVPEGKRYFTDAAGNLPESSKILALLGRIGPACPSEKT
jgi:hypothetical protein